MKTFLRDFKDGINAYSEALKVIRERKLWGYMLVPGLLSLGFGILIALLAQAFAGGVSDFVGARYPWEVGAALVRRLSGFIGGVLVWAGAFFTYKYVILILVAPFMSPLSEKVEAYIKNTPQVAGGFQVTRFMKELARGVRISIRNIVRELAFTLLLLIIGGIPVIGLLSAPGLFAVQAYYAGFGNMDFTLERHMGVRASAEFVRDYRGLAIANGTVFLLLLMIPIAGLFLAPSLATVAGTIESVERLEYENVVV